MYYIHCFNRFVCVRGNPGVIKQWDLKHGGWRRTYQPWLFLPLGFWKQYEWIGGGEDFLQNVHEGSDANIDTSTIQETYFQSSNLESDYDDNDGCEEI